MKKINLPIAAKDSQKIDLANRHIGTTDFFRPFLNYYLESVPKDKIHAKIRSYCQGYPLAGAMLGQFTSSMHAFFAPFRTVMSDYFNFMTGKECRYYGTQDGYNTDDLIVGVRERVPMISQTDIFYLFFPNFSSHLGSENPFKLNLVPVSTSNSDLQHYLMDNFNVLQGNNPFVYTYVVVNTTTPVWFDNKFVDYSAFDFYPSFKDSVPDGSKFDLIGRMSSYSGTTWTNYEIGVILTPYGRLFYQLLISLGLKFHFGGRFSFNTSTEPVAFADYSSEITENITRVTEYSALPLLSLYKVFIDWFIPSKFDNNYDTMLQTMSMLQYPFRDIYHLRTDSYSRPYPLATEILLYTSYPNDYFTNAFLYPNGSNSGESDLTYIKDITLSRNSAGNIITNSPVSSVGDFNTPYFSEDGALGSAPTTITSFTLRALRALNNYVRRNQIVGYKAVDRFLAHFGVKLDYVHTNRTVLIKSNSSDFFPLEVISQADTHTQTSPTPESQQALLGGKSSNIVFNNELEFDYYADEQGMYFVLSSVYPKVGYVQGLDRQFLHRKKDDFYTAEFDSLGVQPILCDELYAERPSGDNNSGQIFGYTVRYADYKYKQDILSGDFYLGSRNSFLESLHTFRIFDRANVPRSINNEFLIGSAAEYDRVFQMVTDSYDHLQVASYNDVSLQRHVDSAADVNDITDGSGQYMETSVGGNYTLR